MPITLKISVSAMNETEDTYMQASKSGMAASEPNVPGITGINPLPNPSARK
jgi:hypothetical protein